MPQGVFLLRKLLNRERLSRRAHRERLSGRAHRERLSRQAYRERLRGRAYRKRLSGWAHRERLSVRGGKWYVQENVGALRCLLGLVYFHICQIGPC